MSATPNRNLDKPAHNSDIDTWDAPLNSNSDIIDASLGGVTSINVTGATGTIVLSDSTGSPPSYINPIIELAGTLTANVNYQFPSGVGGNYAIFNAAGGAFTITFSSGGAGSTVIVPSGAAALLSVDGTNVLKAQTMAQGANTQVQYNSGGSLAGSANLTFDGTTLSGVNAALTGTLAVSGTAAFFGVVTSPSVAAVALSASGNAAVNGNLSVGGALGTSATSFIGSGTGATIGPGASAVIFTAPAIGVWLVGVSGFGIWSGAVIFFLDGNGGAGVNVLIGENLSFTASAGSATLSATNNDPSFTAHLAGTAIRIG